MPTTQQEQQPTHSEQQRRQELHAAIGKHVLHLLGQPDDLHGIQVRQLWTDHYRVNVLVGVEVTSVRVAHSYFVVTDSAGNVLAATPTITKEYQRVARGW
jgi:hypothetical protein